MSASASTLALSLPLFTMFFTFYFTVHFLLYWQYNGFLLLSSLCSSRSISFCNWWSNYWSCWISVTGDNFIRTGFIMSSKPKSSLTWSNSCLNISRSRNSGSTSFSNRSMHFSTCWSKVIRSTILGNGCMRSMTFLTLPLLFSWYIFIIKDLPLSSISLNFNASSDSSIVLNVTKPNPLDWPFSRCSTTALSALSQWKKISGSSCLTPHSKLLTYTVSFKFSLTTKLWIPLTSACLLCSSRCSFLLLNWFEVCIVQICHCSFGISFLLKMNVGKTTRNSMLITQFSFPWYG